jgi:arylsulfatase A-like enzyme
MKADKAYLEKMTHTPFGNEMIFETGKHAIEEEQLGADSIPDILALSFSTPDFALHSYGPQSEEALDMAVRLDRQLAEFMTWLQESIPGGLESTLIILTADHGVAPVPELAHTRHKYPAQRVSGEIVDMATTRALASRFPGIAPDGISYGYREPYIYLDHVLLAERGIDAKQAREAIAAEVQALDGVCAAYTRDRIERGDLPPSRISDCVYHNYDPKRSGDITVVLEPSWLPGSGYKGTSHGSPYNYDTHVPLCFAGASIEPGLYTAPADVMDIAPTLSLLLGINSPNCARGRILGEMLR